MPAEVVGHGIAGIRPSGVIQQQLATAWVSATACVSQIERGTISGQDVLVCYATALGGRLNPATNFDDGDITAIPQ